MALKSLRILRVDARVWLVAFGVVRRINVLVGEGKAFGHGADGSGNALTQACKPKPFLRHRSKNHIRLAGLGPDWNYRASDRRSMSEFDRQLVCAGKQINHRWTSAAPSQFEEALPVDFADVSYQAGALIRTSENSRDLLRRPGADDSRCCATCIALRKSLIFLARV